MNYYHVAQDKSEEPHIWRIHLCRFSITQMVVQPTRFTHQGSITVSASYDDEKREIYIEVTDTGIGIAPQNIDRIFQPFDQEDVGISGEQKQRDLEMGVKSLHFVKHWCLEGIKISKSNLLQYSMHLWTWVLGCETWSQDGIVAYEDFNVGFLWELNENACFMSSWLNSGNSERGVRIYS